MDRDRALREQVIALLRGGNAHMGIEAAVADFPEVLINERAPNVEYTFWHLIEHVRLTQLDILEYLTQTDYPERAWPAAYWPTREARATKAEWGASLTAFRQDLEAIIALVADEATDLHGSVPSHAEHTVLREALIVADHNSYHVGELAILRQVVKGWGAADHG
jgi:hypothetical protein